MKLLIVESPAKAKKIQGFLGADWDVRASVGHICDLPGSGQTIPDKYKDLPWIKLGIDVDNGYRTVYLPYEDKKKVIRDLNGACERADEIYLATDPDREGESIAWHLARELGLKNPLRVTYQEITEKAVKAAIEKPRRIDMNLVAAQEVRRILDRLVGYGTSPLVSRSLGTNEKRKSQSAGRVQSAALKLLAGREHARMAFTSAGVAGVKVRLGTTPEMQATAVVTGGKVIATPGSFGADGMLKPDAAEHLILGEAHAKDLAASLSGTSATISQITKKPLVRRPPAPLTTSGLQQAAGRLKFSSKKTAEVAQKLYEQGLITYIRTDSPVLSDEAVQKGQAKLVSLFGAGVLPTETRRHSAKGNAQEAHEAIRPTYFKTPEEAEIEGDELTLYRLIYETTLASLMKDAVGERTTVTLTCGDTVLSTGGTVITEPGFLELLNDPVDEGEQAEGALPPDLAEGQSLGITRAEVTSSQSKPPARFTEGKLIAALEKVGIGRPSTYPNILAVLLARGYIVNEKNQIHVTPLGMVATGYLSEQMPTIVDREFTARMETDLDRIAAGDLQAQAYLDQIWKGQFAPAIAKASVKPPLVAVPGFPGAVLSSSGGNVTLTAGGQTATLHDQVLSEQLRPTNQATLMAGKTVSGAARKKSTSSKAKSGGTGTRRRKTASA